MTIPGRQFYCPRQTISIVRYLLEVTSRHTSSGVKVDINYLPSQNVRHNNSVSVSIKYGYPPYRFNAISVIPLMIWNRHSRYSNFWYENINLHASKQNVSARARKCMRRTFVVGFAHPMTYVEKCVPYLFLKICITVCWLIDFAELSVPYSALCKTVLSLFGIMQNCPFLIRHYAKPSVPYSALCRTVRVTYSVFRSTVRLILTR